MLASFCFFSLMLVITDFSLMLAKKENPFLYACIQVEEINSNKLRTNDQIAPSRLSYTILWKVSSFFHLYSNVIFQVAYLLPKDICVSLKNEFMITVRWECEEGKCKDWIEISNFGCLHSNNAHENAFSYLKYWLYHYVSVSAFSIGLELKHLKDTSFFSKVSRTY